jgi:protein SCO1/2
LGLLGLAFALACGPSSQFYEGHGLIEEVQAETGQVVIAHEDIPDFMPAMTMNFDVVDAELLGRLAAGQIVDFTIEFDGRSYRVVDATVTGEAAEKDGWIRMGGGLVRTDPAPDFALTDQAGGPFARADLDGKAVLMDFIYTNCPGPCPILSRNLVTVQKSLAPELQERVWFVSVTLDPETDTPEVLRAYAKKHGMDLSNWSLLTGDTPNVDEVVKSYGVGSVRAADGVTIDHRVATFLIDPKGRIARRYLGLQHSPERMAADLSDLAG